MGMELIFEVRDGEEGGYCARALGHAIFTEAETWDELRSNVLEATSLHFEDGSAGGLQSRGMNQGNHVAPAAPVHAEAVQIGGDHRVLRVQLAEPDQA